MKNKYYLLLAEITIKASRSGGKGGQHVNKVSTKIELIFDIVNSRVLSPGEKNILLTKLKNRISTDGCLRIVAQSERSQLQNKKTAFSRFFDLLEKAFQPVKKRIGTQPTRSSKTERLNSKKKKAEKKIMRRKKADWE